MTHRPLPAGFYARETELVARELLGAILECTARGVRCSGRIVETEAYTGEEDAACHAAAGRTARTEILYGPPGRAYVYFVYGMHWCANAVTRRAGLPSAVLIRALEPLEGIAAMRRRRGVKRDRELTNGPAKLCEALAITGAHNGVSLRTPPLRILRGDAVPDGDVEVTGRIGISKAAEEPLRWIVRSSAFVSGRNDARRAAERDPQRTEESRTLTKTCRSTSRNCTAAPPQNSW
ncbi:MAG: DNA-3-methyladenine glycosylase [Gemmatimonadales bacterium]